MYDQPEIDIEYTLLQFVERGGAPLEQGVPVDRRLNASRRTIKQPHAEHVF
jgi:hypothetical protein